MNEFTPNYMEMPKLPNLTIVDKCQSKYLKERVKETREIMDIESSTGSMHNVLQRMYFISIINALLQGHTASPDHIRAYLRRTQKKMYREKHFIRAWNKVADYLEIALKENTEDSMVEETQISFWGKLQKSIKQI